MWIRPPAPSAEKRPNSAPAPPTCPMSRRARSPTKKETSTPSGIRIRNPRSASSRTRSQSARSSASVSTRVSRHARHIGAASVSVPTDASSFAVDGKPQYTQGGKAAWHGGQAYPAPAGYRNARSGSALPHRVQGICGGHVVTPLPSAPAPGAGGVVSACPFSWRSSGGVAPPPSASLEAGACDNAHPAKGKGDQARTHAADTTTATITPMRTAPRRRINPAPADADAGGFRACWRPKCGSRPRGR